MSNSTLGPNPQSVELCSELILAFLDRQPGPVSTRQILGSFKGRKQIKLQAIASLVEQEKIEKTGQGVRGDPCFYRVAAAPGGTASVGGAIK